MGTARARLLAKQRILTAPLPIFLRNTSIACMTVRETPGQRPQVSWPRPLCFQLRPHPYNARIRRRYATLKPRNSSFNRQLTSSRGARLRCSRCVRHEQTPSDDISCWLLYLNRCGHSRIQWFIWPMRTNDKSRSV
jgi:hypothetical protein